MAIERPFLHLEITVNKPFRLFGLLHLAKSESSAENVKVRSFKQQIAVYLRNAVTLSKSLAQQGYEFILLTNDKTEVDDSLRSMGLSNLLVTQTLYCSTKVPTGVRFYSAHYKLDVFRYLGTLPPESYSGFVDLDVIAVNSAPPCLDEIITAGIPLCYDISDQVIPAYGHERILSDMQRLSSAVCEGRWSGGEFLCGPTDFFSAVYEECLQVFERYNECFTDLHHQGDEIITSVALENLRISRRFYIADAGKLNIIGRYWSCSVRHPQPQFEYFQNCFLLHLPADKKWLADLATTKPQSTEGIFTRYRRHLKFAGLKSPARKVWKLFG